MFAPARTGAIRLEPENGKDTAMPDYRSMFDKKYLGAWDLNGRDVTVTIRDVKAEQVSNGTKKDKKPVIRLEKTEKLFLCNKTNADIIAGMYGPKTEDWVGRRITLYPTQTSFGSKQVDAIRVRPVVPREKVKSEGVATRPVDPEMRARQDEAAAEAGVPHDADGVVTEQAGPVAEPSDA